MMPTLVPDLRRRRQDSWREFDVITRRVDPTAASPSRFGAGTELDLGPVGRLRLDEPFVAADDDPGCWRARGRVIGRGPRLARYARVEVVLQPWSADTHQLRIVPRSPFLPRWGVRRRRRYYDLAHAAADRLLQGFAGPVAC